MEYHLYNENGRNAGITGVEPTHSNWTLTPYLGGFVKEFWNGSQWVESASIEEIAIQEAEIQDELKKQQYQELLPTDWYVVRFFETGIAIPQNILNERQMIRNKY